MENLLLFTATARGLYVFRRDGDQWSEVAGGERSHHFTSVAARDGLILAGSQDGIFRSNDMGQTWWEANEGLTIRHVRWMAIHPDDVDLAFAGTEPAAIFVSHDGGSSWEECPEVAELRDEYDWNLPYSPKAGCIRGFAFHGSRGYAAAEQGGFLVSDSRGETWGLAAGSTGDPDRRVPENYIHPDVHSVAVHPTSADRVFAPTGGGFYYSTDGGTTWDQIYQCYCRAVWLDPADPGHIVFGPADSVDRNGRIEESIDGGQPWEPIMSGLDDVWSEHMVERFVQADDELLAVLSNGELIAAPLGTQTWRWRQVLPALQDVNAAAVMPD